MYFIFCNFVRVDYYDVVILNEYFVRVNYIVKFLIINYSRTLDFMDTQKGAEVIHNSSSDHIIFPYLSLDLK